MPRFIIRPEWRLLDPRVDLEALEIYLTTVEQQLAFLRNQWRIRLTADLKDASNKDESDWLWHESRVRETLVTRSLRGGFIMSLWASYESGVLEVADFLKDKKGLRLRRSSPELCVKERGSSSMLRLGCLGDLLRFEKREIEVAALAPDRSSPQSNRGDEAERTGSVGEGAGAPDSTLDLGVQALEAVRGA